jgi:uncharacterized protein with von Willebrand factor type A (vWA) domain
MPQAQLTGARTLIEFAGTLRAAGLRTDPNRLRSLFAALAALPATDLRALHLCGRLTLCSSGDEVQRYDRCFAEFFLSAGAPGCELAADPEQSATLPGSELSLSVDPGQHDDSPRRELEVGATSPVEVLRNRKLAGLDEQEKAQIHALIARLQSRVASRPSRRFRSAHRGVLDVRGTARSAMARAGEPARLKWRQRQHRPRKRVLLVDISGSMTPFAGGLLRLAYAAYRCAPRHTEVFTFGTRLTRITPYLRSGDPEAALVGASKAIPDWSGGTRIGDQLKAFLDGWGQRGMARGAIVVVASDGWERGDTERLRTQAQRLRSLAKRVLWVNPHKSTPGFEPLTRGMQAALPYVDRLVAGSTVNELATLLDLMGNDRIGAGLMGVGARRTGT